MNKSPLPRALWLPLVLYLIGWIALFALIAVRLDLIAPLIEYRKLVYLFGLAIWHVFVFIAVVNRQVRAYVETLLPLQPPLPLAGLMFGLAAVDLGLLYVLST
jgi:hypothetical protein